MGADILVGRRGQPVHVIPCFLLNIRLLQIVELQWLWEISSVCVILVYEVSHIYTYSCHIWLDIQCSLYRAGQHKW